MCDPSDYAIGVLLGQHIDKKAHVIHYAVYTFNDAQINYTIIGIEFLATAFTFFQSGMLNLGF